MKWITLGALLALLWILCPALVIGLVSNSVVVAFGLGVAARPQLARHFRGAAKKVTA